MSQTINPDTLNITEHEAKVQRLLKMLDTHRLGETVKVEKAVEVVQEESRHAQNSSTSTVAKTVLSLNPQQQAKLMVSLALRKYEQQQHQPDTNASSQPFEKAGSDRSKVAQKLVPASKPQAPRLVKYDDRAKLASFDNKKSSISTSQSANPIESPADPRWVLAIRISEKMEGPILRPEMRDKLVRLGKSLGLTAFDANMIIAILQDQARRGHQPSQCPAAGKAQIQMIQPYQTPKKKKTSKKLVSILVLLSLTIEIILLGWFI